MKKITEENGSNIFAIDFRNYLMDLGGYKDPNKTLVWSEIDIDPKQINYTFSIYEFNICGANILSNFSSYFFAEITTDIPCLLLPSTLFIYILNYFNLTCYNFYCTFPSIENLPSFSFKLSENGRYFFIPLISLFMGYDHLNQAKVWNF
eukprot:Anaeramoba_ignava/a4146_7.p1 GENE.a4146_7~~a4146_7.p1  ORF type:complete len:149 (-),score=34.06 a4146_7:80-526(-)